MRKLALLLALVCALAWAGTALAVTGYAGPRFWYAGDEAGSSFQSGWSTNDFNKPSSGYDTTVTFIDGLRRVIQTKKDLDCDPVGTQTTQNPVCSGGTGLRTGMSISGKEIARMMSTHSNANQKVRICQLKCDSRNVPRASDCRA